MDAQHGAVRVCLGILSKNNHTICDGAVALGTIPTATIISHTPKKAITDVGWNSENRRLRLDGWGRCVGTTCSYGHPQPPYRRGVCDLEYPP